MVRPFDRAEPKPSAPTPRSRRCARTQRRSATRAPGRASPSAGSRLVCSASRIAWSASSSRTPQGTAFTSPVRTKSRVQQKARSRSSDLDATYVCRVLCAALGCVDSFARYSTPDPVLPQRGAVFRTEGDRSRKKDLCAPSAMFDNNATTRVPSTSWPRGISLVFEPTHGPARVGHARRKGQGCRSTNGHCSS